MVIEKKGPISALKESAALLKKTWGQQLIGNFSFVLVLFVLILPGAVFVLMALLTMGTPAMIVFIALAGAYIILLCNIIWALGAIFCAAVYLYARDGRAPGSFDSFLLSDAIVQR
ncbi:MAG: hypothetical protein JSU94_19175 [Phycisphaerales bacterium]|nr:MAG: hypothetical protein JSU94_19175 [Phycisphaerales bacterium]